LPKVPCKYKPEGFVALSPGREGPSPPFHLTLFVYLAGKLKKHGLLAQVA